MISLPGVGGVPESSFGLREIGVTSQRSEGIPGEARSSRKVLLLLVRAYVAGDPQLLQLRSSKP